jgi:hypothetical protein
MCNYQSFESEMELNLSTHKHTITGTGGGTSGSSGPYHSAVMLELSGVM